MTRSLIEMLQKNKFSLIVSLPSNDIELARTAIKNGADAIKAHVNLSHRASGNSFGTIEENREFLTQLMEEFDGPIGIVPGDNIEKINPADIQLLEEMGISYFSIYAHDCPTFLLQSKLEKTVATNHTYRLEELKQLDKVGIQAFEASIIKGEEYGTPLNVSDLVTYAAIAETVSVPVIIPTQRKVVPEDLPALYQTGVKAVMTGAVSIGKEKESIGKTIRAFRAAMDDVIGEGAE